MLLPERVKYWNVYHDDGVIFCVKEMQLQESAKQHVLPEIMPYYNGYLLRMFHLKMRPSGEVVPKRDIPPAKQN